MYSTQYQIFCQHKRKDISTPYFTFPEVRIVQDSVEFRISPPRFSDPYTACNRCLISVNPTRALPPLRVMNHRFSFAVTPYPYSGCRAAVCWRSYWKKQGGTSVRHE